MFFMNSQSQDLAAGQPVTPRTPSVTARPAERWDGGGRRLVMPFPSLWE